jgi:uncharacterized protein YciI/uncharacterized protein YndB with AHSA1/START domain
VSTVPPIRREILVDAGPATAFEVFTGDIGRWWPVTEYSVYGAGGTVTLANSEIVERSADGHSALWGTITRWEPPVAVAFTWHPGQTADRASHVEVTFAPAGPAAGQTLVTLVHRGWDSLDDPAAARAEYDEGWPVVLGRYGGHFATLLPPPGSEPDPAGETWVALLHRPGRAAPPDGRLFEDPRIGEHFAFLSRMREAGYLVAAGPLTDEDGAGMTVLRLPGANQLDEARRLATEDDASVASGFLDVSVRPWKVMLTQG